jgi:Domain of unknown function (DUF4411)
VHQWAKSQVDLFVPLTAEVQMAVREVLSQHPWLVGAGSRRSRADPFVIALARVRNGVVVTEETLSRNIEKPKILDVCDALSVPRLTLMGFVQKQGWIFCEPSQRTPRSDGVGHSHDYGVLPYASW